MPAILTIRFANCWRTILMLAEFAWRLVYIIVEGRREGLIARVLLPGGEEAGEKYEHIVERPEYFVDQLVVDPR